MGINITLPRPILIIDGREQKPYSFRCFRKWVAEANPPQANPH